MNRAFSPAPLARLWREILRRAMEAAGRRRREETGGEVLFVARLPRTSAFRRLPVLTPDLETEPGSGGRAGPARKNTECD